MILKIWHQLTKSCFLQVSSPFQSFFGSSSTPIIRTSFPRLMIRIPLGPAHSSRQKEIEDAREESEAGNKPLIFGRPHTMQEDDGPQQGGFEGKI